jgi:hypothetical protein
MANKGIFEKCAKWSEKRKLGLLEDLISIIANNVTYGIGMAVYRADYDRVLSEEPEVVHMALGSPYAFCAFRCFESGADWSIKNRSPEPINYVFEQGDQHSDQIFNTHHFICNYEPLRRRYWLGSLLFDPKKNTSLQAADLLTWELNREYYRQDYPEPEYAYSRPTLVALMERIDGDYRNYGEDELKGYLQDFIKKTGKFFMVNVPEKIAKTVERRLNERQVRDREVRTLNVTRKPAK